MSRALVSASRLMPRVRRWNSDWMAAAEREARQQAAGRRSGSAGSAQEVLLAKVEHEMKGEGMSMTVKLEERLQREIATLADLRRDITRATAVHSTLATRAHSMVKPTAATARIPDMRTRYEELRKTALATKQSLTVQREVATGQIQAADADERWTVPPALPEESLEPRDAYPDL